MWDVHRLIELSRSLPTEEVEVESILAREADFWFSTEKPATPRDVATHAKLIEETDLALSDHPVCGRASLG